MPVLGWRTSWKEPVLEASNYQSKLRTESRSAKMYRSLRVLRSKPCPCSFRNSAHYTDSGFDVAHVELAIPHGFRIPWQMLQEDSYNQLLLIRRGLYSSSFFHIIPWL